MPLVNFLDLKVFRGETLEKVKTSGNPLRQTDLVEITSKTGSGFWRPLKVSWRLEVETGPVINQIRSKRARKQIGRDEKKLEGRGVTIKSLPQIDEALFLEWLALYIQKLKSKERGRIVIAQNWLKEKKKRGKQVGAVLAFRAGKVIGGNLFYRINNRLSVAYGVAEPVDGLVGGLGMLLDYYTVIFAQKTGFESISLGQDTNLYGFHLSPGLLFYKAKLGFRPVPADKSEWVSTYFLDMSKFGDQIMFFGQEKSELELVVISKEKTIGEPYLPLGVSGYRCFEQKTVLEKHRHIFSIGVEHGQQD